MIDYTTFEPLIQTCKDFGEMVSDPALLRKIDFITRAELRQVGKMLDPHRVSENIGRLQADADHITTVLMQTANEYIGDKKHPIHRILLGVSNFLGHVDSTPAAPVRPDNVAKADIIPHFHLR